MKRIIPHPIYVATLCIASTLFAANQQPAVNSSNPNVLFIAVDDLKPTISAYGTEVPTPSIDRIAAQGTTFLNAHCQQAVCGPSRASLLTGKLPDSTKVWDLKTKIRKVLPDVVTLPQHFKNNGYHAVGMGKIYDPRSVDKGADTLSWSEPYKQTWHLQYNSEAGKPTGHYHNAKSKELAAGADNAQWDAVSKKLFENNAWPIVEAEALPDDAYDDGAIANQAVNTLSKLAQQDKPFFLAVGFKKPHLPFVAPKKYWDMFDRSAIQLETIHQLPEGAPSYAGHTSPELRSYNGVPQQGALDEATQRELIHGYYACVAYIDAQIGKILNKLEAEGLAENTIIVFWGDHGWHLGDHGLWCKHTNFEQATRVPLIITSPSGKSLTTNMPAELTDLFPTLCELASIPAPEGLEGKSLAPTVNDADQTVRQFALSQFPRGTRMGYALRTERFRFVAWYEISKNKGAQKGDRISATELYDYEKDPLETRNLVNAPQYKTVVTAMQQQLSNMVER